MSHALKHIALAAAACALAGTAQAQVSGDVVKIGIITDMSGLYADLDGAGGVEAIKLAIADMKGMAAGKKIEVVYADHQNKADVAASKAPELVPRWRWPRSPPRRRSPTS